MFSHTSPRLARLEDFCASARRMIRMCLVACGIALLLCSAAHAQGGVPLVTVVTDKTPLSLSNQFGVPTFTAINQGGDFAFIGNGRSALFFRAAAASSATLLLQIGDQVPGIPGSLIVSFSPVLGLNAAKFILFGVGFNLPDGFSHTAILSYSGSSYSIVATSDEVAPGSGGAFYGTSLTPGSINDEGDINFTAVPSGKFATTHYIVPSGQVVAVRVAAFNDPPPPSCAWCFVTGSVSASIDFTDGTTYVPPLNASGQVPISVAGGLFIGSKDGLQLVPLPSSGPCSPASPTFPEVPNFFPLTGNGVPLNNTGTVAFLRTSGSGSAICVSTGGGLAGAVVSSGDAAPAAIGGTFLYLTLGGLDDSGDILFAAEIIGGTTTEALLRYHPSSGPTGHVDVVAYLGEALPAPRGSTSASPSITLGPPTSSIPFPAFTAVSMSNSGLVSFHVLLSPSGDAIYQQAGTTAPVPVAFSGQTAPSGGTLNLSSILFTETLNNGATFFASAVANGSASFGEFLGTATSLQTLMTTADTLPTNARIAMTGALPTAAGHFVAFVAQLPGAGRSLFVSDVSSGVITRVVSDGNTPIPTILGMLGTPTVGPNFFVNENGQVAFEVVSGYESLVIGTGLNISGTGQSDPFFSFSQITSCGTLFLWSPSTGLTKVVASGDTGPLAGTTFLCASLNAGQLSPLNGSGQITFDGTLTSSTSPPFARNDGVFVYTPGGVISQLVAVNSSIPSLALPVSRIPNLANPINTSGEVAFGAVAGTSSLSAGYFQGFLLETAGGVPSIVVGNGDSIPDSGKMISSPNFISGLDDNGDLAFTSTTTAAADGLFLAPSGGGIQTIALDGGAAPTVGTFSLAAPVTIPGGAITINVHSNFALMNNESDVAFRAGITGGTGDSGYFRRMHSVSSAGVLQPVVLQGQALPQGGTLNMQPGTETLNTVPFPGSQGADFALGPDGSLAFVNGFTSASNTMQGMFVSRPDGTILRVLASGDTAPGGGTVNGLSMSQGLAAGEAGKFVFWAGIKDGGARQAIFVTALPLGIASASVTLSSPQNSSVFGQPITLAATVNSTATGSPSGSIGFFDSGVLIGTGAVSAGQAALNISSLTTGSHSIVAQYSGDTNFAPSNSSALAETINPRMTSTALASSLSPAVGGQSITFTATVTTTAGGSPTGTVTFLDGSTTIGTATLNGSAVATLTPPTLSVGAHPITVSYGGDPNSATSTSNAVNETVAVAGFALPPTNLVVTAGQSLVIPLTLYAAPGSNLTFMLGCSGLPAGATCAFGPNPVNPGAPPNGTVVQLTLSTMAASTLFPGEPRRGPWPMGVIRISAILFAFLMAGMVKFRQAPWRRLAFGVCLEVFTLALVMAGCGASTSNSSGGSPGTPKGLVAINVTGTSGATTVTTVVNVTVR